MVNRCVLLFAAVVSAMLSARGDENVDENDYYRVVPVVLAAGSDSRAANWQPAPDGLVLEVSGLTVLDDRRIAVAIRKGEIWILDGVYDDPATDIKYHRFASALHDPMGLIYKDGSYYTVQRSELTRLRDLDGDEVADEYLAVAKGWGVTGHYHEYSYGPKLDQQGNFWLTLNLGLGIKGEQLERSVSHPTLGYHQGLWRGWALKVNSNGEMKPICGGMRSPCGIGQGPDGEMFYTDQQGNWVATNSLHRLRKGAFHHHPEALASAEKPGSTLAGITSVPNGLPFPDALQKFPQMVPPAVWFPYKKMGQSATDIMMDNSGGNFGPFAGQLFVGEFTQASINRVFLEKVEGEYQGACFPFRSGMASAVLRLTQGVDGSVFAGLTNRGWSSLGTASYGLQRLVWTGKNPFEIKEMRAKPDGFELVMTSPVDPATAIDPASYQLSSYTYLYHSTYGSDEIQTNPLKIIDIKLSDDHRRVRLVIAGLREKFVHELQAPGVRDVGGQPLLHPRGYYTLNRIPKQ